MRDRGGDFFGQAAVEGAGGAVVTTFDRVDLAFRKVEDCFTVARGVNKGEITQ
jgi:hypothetical protein